MIALSQRFGRSASTYSIIHLQLQFFFIIICLLFLCYPGRVLAFGDSGLYTTKVKFEYQYSDYDEYSYPVLPSDDPLIAYKYSNPYIIDFPEQRSLAKVVQYFGSETALDLRYEYSSLAEGKDQHRYHARLDKNITAMTTIYGAYQYLARGYDSRDSTDSDAHMIMAGVKHDRSGWIKAEASFSYDRSRSPLAIIAKDSLENPIDTLRTTLLTETYMPMVQFRWSVNSVTALSARWDGYWAVNDSGTFPSHALTVSVSRYFPTQTALHLFTRLYRNDTGIESFSPAVEIAQYIRWNLTARLTYRFYRNWFSGENVPVFIKRGTISSHSIRAYIEWQIGADIKLHLKVRRYISDQDIRMNMYLVGFEYEL